VVAMETIEGGAGTTVILHALNTPSQVNMPTTHDGTFDRLLPCAFLLIRAVVSFIALVCLRSQRFDWETFCEASWLGNYGFVALFRQWKFIGCKRGTT
jgi:hypothetical protein